MANKYKKKYDSESGSDSESSSSETTSSEEPRKKGVEKSKHYSSESDSEEEKYKHKKRKYSQSSGKDIPEREHKPSNVFEENNVKHKCKDKGFHRHQQDEFKEKFKDHSRLENRKRSRSRSRSRDQYNSENRDRPKRIRYENREGKEYTNRYADKHKRDERSDSANRDKDRYHKRYSNYNRNRSQSRDRDENKNRDKKEDRNSRNRSKSFDHANAKWGRSEDENNKSGKQNSTQKEKPNFGLSGKLTEETNTYKGVVIKYSEPPESRKPRRRWRLYPFKGEKALQTLYIHRQSAYLIGRDRKIADLPVDHPSCSKQHAVLQYRLVPFTRDNGTVGKRVRPYIIDLESANGTSINNKKIEAKKYIELLERDVIKFGFSSREYVLLHENSKDEALDDDVKQEEEEEVVVKQEV